MGGGRRQGSLAFAAGLFCPAAVRREGGSDLTGARGPSSLAPVGIPRASTVDSRAAAVRGIGPMAILRAVSGALLGQSFRLRPSGTILGRNNDADIVLENDAVSRNHARILQNELGQWVVQDLESMNGTSVNGAYLAKGEAGKHVLAHRDQVRLCAFHFLFELEESGAATALVRMVDDVETQEKTSVRLPASPDDVDVQDLAQEKLRAVMGLIDSLASSSSLVELLPKVLKSLVAVFPRAQRGFIQLREDGPDDESGLVTAAVYPPQLEEPIYISRTIVNEVLKSRQATLSRDALEDQRFSSSQSVAEMKIRSLMCAPLLDSAGDVLGVIELDMLDANRTRYFTPDELKVLANVARYISIIIENARLHERAIKEQRLKIELERIEHDLDVARRLQRGLLPNSAPKVSGYGFYSVYQPAEKVGGDFYDFIRLADHRWAVLVADVSGEGVPAALVMARFAGDARHYLGEVDDPCAALGKLNQSLIRSDLDGRYITLVVAIIDPLKHEVTLVNAGHWAPLLRKANGATQALTGADTDFSLGWFADARFHAYTVQLQPGDRIAMFTDGILDARDIKGEQYGPVRLHKALAQPAASAVEQGKYIFADVRNFASEAPQADDMCLLVFGRK